MDDLEFETDLTVEVAAGDSRLVAWNELRMKDDTGADVSTLLGVMIAGPEPYAMKHTISNEYGLSNAMYNRALGRCIALVAGIKTGKDFFEHG